MSSSSTPTPPPPPNPSSSTPPPPPNPSSSTPPPPPNPTSVVNIAAMAPDLYVTDVEKDKATTLSAVANIEKALDDATGSAAKTAAVLAGISALGLTAICGAKLSNTPKEVFDVIQNYVFGGLGSAAGVSLMLVGLYGYRYSVQRKRMDKLVAESKEVLAVIATADAATRYRVNREAGNSSSISRSLNRTWAFLLPSLLKMAVIYGVTFALVVMTGKVADKIA